jgi:hypothetical protein
MKVLYSLLNWKRYDKDMAKSLSKLQNEDVLICTDDKSRWNEKLYKFIEADESIAVSKNKILNYALENGYTHCFIIEDDVFIQNKIIFLEYLQVMETFEINIMMYGFHNNLNKVLNGKVNPCMLITTKNHTPYCINRFPCSAFILYRIFDDMTLFDERLKVMEHDFLMQDLVDQDNYKFSGFIFDVYDSWNKIKKIPLDKIKKSNQEAILHDKEIRNVTELSMSNNGDEIIQHIVEKLRG